jgi:hypothetical protein
VLVSGCSSDAEDSGVVADSASSAEPQPSRSATSTPSPSPGPVEVSPSPPPPPPAAPASLESIPGFVAEEYIDCNEATSLIQAMSSAERVKLAELIALTSESFDIGDGIDVLEGFVAGRGFTVNVFGDDDQQWTFLVGTGWFRDERTAAQTQGFGQFVNDDGDCGEYSL